MKKSLIVAALLCAMALLLAPQTFATTKLVYWDLFSGGDADFMTAMVKEFNRTHPDIFVDEVPNKWDDYYNHLLTALVAKKGPDVCIIHTSNLPAFASKKVLLPLDGPIAKYNFPAKDFGAKLWNGGKYQGKQVAIPLDVHPFILYYNKELLARAGFMKDDKPQIPANPEEFASFLKTIRAKTGKFPLTLETNGFGGYRSWYSLLNQAGGSLMSANGKKMTVNSETALKTLTWWTNLLKENGINSMNYDESVALFSQGQSALHINGVWVTGGFEKQNGLKFGAMPFPNLFGSKDAWGNSHNFVIPNPAKADPNRIKATLTFIDWMTANSDKWALAGHIPPRYSVLQGEKYKSMPYRPGYAAQMESIAYLPSNVHMLEIEQFMADEIAAAYSGAKTPAQALATIEQKSNRVLK
ncbi:carbohydrate ABC transporter substrate-binding protein (CUT1 family) [Hydrogenispora ethanolica]|uniref:Carbohydrate ABC transporter substrate-binding protein (CUT1 family) n=1 Tax=Hydrogenispora ethanolica TaxID=1082276 RepID=A0A4R1R0K0_HYDET|nr:ABC transporter substrate-binding protein [Hydrogenispora ethanolica]TCL58812.1 carbohydrate ABC transporter substrate-binding protein (CUT1 family) [Hydrogenispora ethanolica]